MVNELYLISKFAFYNHRRNNRAKSLMKV